jgi:aryl carrier-like protein
VQITEADRQWARQRGLGPRWDTVRSVRAGDGEAVALIELPSQYAQDLQVMPLHPALLDAATGYANRHFGGGAFLPLSYDRLIVKAPLPARFHSHVCLDRGGTPDTSLLRYDVELTDENGNELVRVEGITFRRVEEEPPAALTTWTGAITHDSTAGLDGMDPSAAVKVFGRLLDSGITGQVIVSPLHPDSIIHDVEGSPEKVVIEQLAAKPLPARPARPRPAVATEYVPPRDEIERRIAAIWSDVLGIDPIGRDDNFLEIGGDSVIAIRAIAMARQAGLKLTPQDFFRHPTLAALARAAAGIAPSPTPSGEKRVPLGVDLDDQQRAALAKALAAESDAGAGQ